MAEVVIDTAIGERDARTGLYAGYFPGCPGAHSQGETLEESYGRTFGKWSRCSWELSLSMCGRLLPLSKL